MALSSNDPKVLFGLSRCFSCITPIQQLRAQTYLLAVLAGLDTSYAGVEALSVASTCMRCLTTPQLIAIKSYLMALALGLDTSQAGVRALAQAAKCYDCLTPHQQVQLQTYLFALADGKATDKAGVAAIEAGAKCFPCPGKKAQLEIQVYILAQIAPGAAQTPAALALAAKCFIACAPAEIATEIQTSLVSKITGSALPPCVTPTVPTSTGFKSKTNTTILISWFQPANPGSLITGYTISWGTTMGGPYPNSVTVGVSPKLYTITGLTAGTQYFWVVVANSFSGCSSANSAESNTTTNGNPPGPPNHLLTGLIGLWQLNELVAGNRADSSGNGLTLTDTDANIPGVANASVANFSEWADCNANAGDAVRGLRHADAAILNPAGSFSFAAWVYIKVKTANSALIGKWGAGPPFGAVIYLTATGDNPTIDIYDTANAANAASSSTGGFAALNINTPYLICGGYNSTLSIWITINAAPRYEVAIGANPFALTTNPFAVGNYGSTSNIAMNAFVSQAGYWSKRLSDQDITALYNAGAGLPFNQFLV